MKGGHGQEPSDGRKNRPGKLNYIGRNKYKILTFVLAGLVIANIFGVTGWFVNSVGQLQISLPEVAWAGSSECVTDDDCLDCEKCEGDKGDKECVDDCPVGEGCTETGCKECDPEEKPEGCYKCDGGEWVETEIDSCKNHYSVKRKDKDLETEFNWDWSIPSPWDVFPTSASWWPGDWTLSWEDIKSTVTDPGSYEVEIGVTLTGRRKGQIKWYCKDEAGFYDSLGCLKDKIAPSHPVEYQNVDVKLDVPLMLTISAEKLAKGIVTVGQDFLMGVYEANVVNLGVILGETARSLINDFSFECPPPCEILE